MNNQHADIVVNYLKIKKIYFTINVVTSTVKNALFDWKLQLGMIVFNAFILS
jgi:hypothetical protein